LSTNNETQSVYDINGKKITDINPMMIDSTKTGINLLGSNISELSDAINSNFINVIQSFYGVDAPINPIMGQQWFNQDELIMYRWLGENWIQTDIDNTFDSYLYIKFNIGDMNEFNIDESVFNFTIMNIKLFNQNMEDVKFVIDPFDSKKIILKQSGVTDLYIMIFHPKDRISNPIFNKKTEFLTSSGQTQFEIDSLMQGTNINTLSVDLNGVLLKNNEFSITNNILTIDGKIYRVRANDILTVWKHGGSLTSYYANLHIITNKHNDIIQIPKFFKDIVTLEFYNIDTKTLINPIKYTENKDALIYQFLDKKMLKADLKIRII